MLGDAFTDVAEYVKICVCTHSIEALVDQRTAIRARRLAAAKRGSSGNTNARRCTGENGCLLAFATEENVYQKVNYKHKYPLKTLESPSRLVEKVGQ